MSKVITFGNQKGGVGKSTALLLAATSLALEGKKVAVIDMDNQQTIGDFVARDQGKALFDFHSLKGDLKIPAFTALMEKLDQENDYVFLDTPGKMEEKGKEEVATRYADYLFIPIEPTEAAFYATLAYVIFVHTRKTQRESAGHPLKVVAFLNKFRTGRKQSRDMYREMKELESKGIEVMFNYLGDYEAFSQLNTYSLPAGDATTPHVNNAMNWLKEFTAIIR